MSGPEPSVSQPIYLDYNATTPVHPSVADVMDRVLREDFGNPSSDHVYGRKGRSRVEEARLRVAALIGCGTADVLFTGGGSESNNLALRGAAEALGDRLGGVVISAVEHPAVQQPSRWLAARGIELETVAVDGAGEVDPEDVERAAEKLSGGGRTVLVSVMHANNEVGTLQPVAEIVRRAKRFGAVVHTDAAQTVGKIPVDVDALGVDLLTIAGHKLYGPKGVGALFVRPGTPLAPFILGAGHERGLRAGTENVAGAAGLGEACRLARVDGPAHEGRIRAMRDRLLEGLLLRIPGLRRNGHPRRVLPNTLHMSFPDAAGRDVLARCPGIAASTGSACHEGEDRPSGVLGAMGLSTAEAIGAVRLSLGVWTEEDHVDLAADLLAAAWKEVVG